MAWKCGGYPVFPGGHPDPVFTPGTILAPVGSDDSIHPDGKRMAGEQVFPNRTNLHRRTTRPVRR